MKSFKSLLPCVISMVWICPVGAITYQRQDTWGDTVWAVREGVQAYNEQVKFKPFHSELLQTGQAPQKVVLPLHGVRKIALIARRTSGTSYSHATWGDGVLKSADGSSKLLAEFRPVYAKIGKGKLLTDQGYDNKPLKIAEKTFQHGFLAHTNSKLIFEFDSAYDYLEIYIGINNTAAPGGGAKFDIEDASVDFVALWNKLSEEFPAECIRAQQDIGRERCLVLHDPDKPFEFGAGDFEALIEDLRPNDLTTRRQLDEILTRADSASRCKALLNAYSRATQKALQVFAVRQSIKSEQPDLARMTKPQRLNADELHKLLSYLADSDKSRRIKSQLNRLETALSKIEITRVNGGREAAGELQRVTTALNELGEALSRERGWPTFRSDVIRSSISRQQLNFPLYKQWVHTPNLPPSPAWPAPAARNFTAGSGLLSPTQTYDRAYHVVGSGERLYYASSSDDTAYCIDADNGQLIWRFTAEGPMRLAPTLDKDKLYVGSDDGYLYCLDASSGKLIWKVLGGPNLSRFCGNGRMISRWPVRCGIVVEEGVVYFTAGVFPSLGVYLCAVNDKDGSEIWKSKCNFVPQGYMLASPNRLFIPTGRTPFRMVNKADGSKPIKLGNSDAWGLDLVGGSFALLVENKLAAGPSEDGQIHLFNTQTTERLIQFYGRQLIVNGEISYILGPDSLMALDRTQYLRENDMKPMWKSECNNGFCMVMAHNMLIVGGDGHLEAFNADSGKLLWRDDSLGRVESLAVCQGRLLVCTNDGRIHCYGAQTAKEPVLFDVASSLQKPFKAFASSNPEMIQAQKRAGKVLAELNSKRGYCLVLNADQGRLVYALAQQSDLRIIGLEPDPKQAARARENLIQAGVYGSDVTIHQGSLEKLSYQDYFANLIIADRPLDAPQASQAKVNLARLLRPCGGVWALENTPEMPSEEGSIKPLTSQKQLLVRSALPGAGEWTHFYADPGNTACSGDARIKDQKMEILWFGRPGPHRMIDRHQKTSAPLYKNGRLFVSGIDYIAAVDAYNGTVLWENDVPQSLRTAAFKSSSNMALADDTLYVAAADACLAFNTTDGETIARYHLPGSDQPSPGEWAYVACVNGILLGTSTKAGSLFKIPKENIEYIWMNDQPIVTSEELFAFETGQDTPSWNYSARGAGAIITPTLAVLDGRVFFVQSDNIKTLEGPDNRSLLTELLGHGASLMALELKTGEKLWQQSVDLKNMHQIIYLSASNGTLLISGSFYPQIDGRQRLRYELVAFDAKTGEELWRNIYKPDYDHVLTGDHGEQVQHPAIVGNIVYGPGFACTLKTGEPYEGWIWHKSHKCTPLSTSLHCAFSRYTAAKLSFRFDLDNGKPTALTYASRPGCWISIIPAGGLVLIPESSSGCTCEYSIQTSLALHPIF
ncbi:MAG: PQQ-binding-like beta-propeller repeat protein [Sedimentisphaerales bacterium]|nr:PQQ-binding-like beta-propeller repeat protein [Sedimentisphaerales bacterium]